VVNAAEVTKASDGANPHLWYSPSAVTSVADAVVGAEDDHVGGVSRLRSIWRRRSSMAPRTWSPIRRTRAPRSARRATPRSGSNRYTPAAAAAAPMPIPSTSLPLRPRA